MTEVSSSKPPKVTGSCACGRITFQADSVCNYSTACYCRECAKVSGNGFLSFANFPTSSIKWSTQPDIWKSSSVAERAFCKECGSTISMLYYHEAEEISIVMSMIDETSEPLPRLRKHIFLKEKADWVILPDDGSQRCDTT